MEPCDTPGDSGRTSDGYYSQHSGFSFLSTLGRMRLVFFSNQCSREQIAVEVDLVCRMS